nr:PREDICTED: uncharacterized protein LOC109039079 [Bemisia tabaci]
MDQEDCPRLAFVHNSIKSAPPTTGKGKVVLNVVRKITQPNATSALIQPKKTTITNKRNRDEDSTAAQKKWPPEHILELIIAYKGHPCLYDLKHPQYSNNGKRMMTLAEIRQLMDIFRPGMTEEDILRQLNSVRTQF